MKHYLGYFGLCVMLGAPIGAVTRAQATTPCRHAVIEASLELRSSTVDGLAGILTTGPRTGVRLIRGQSSHELRGDLGSRTFVLHFLPSEEP